MLLGEKEPFETRRKGAFRDKEKRSFCYRRKGAFCYKEERKRGKREETELLMKNRKRKKAEKAKTEQHAFTVEK